MDIKRKFIYWEVSKMKKFRKGILEFLTVLIICTPLVYISDMMY